MVNDGEIDVSGIVKASGLERAALLCTAGHTGPSAARNAGLAAASGRMVAYLDDDDIFRPDHLERHAEVYVAQPETRVVYSDAERISTPGGTVDVPYSSDFDADALMIENYIPIICLTHGRDCLDEVGLFEPSLHYLEDWDLFIRLSLRWPFVHIPEVTAAFFEDGSGANVREQYADRFVESMNTVYARSNALLADDPVRLSRINDLRLCRVARMTYSTGKMCEEAGDLDRAASAYDLAIKYDPRSEYYLALARMLRARGDRIGALTAIQTAEHLRAMEQEGGEAE